MNDEESACGLAKEACLQAYPLACMARLRHGHRRNTPQPTIINIVGPGWKSTLPAEVGQVIQATLPQGFTLMRS